MKKLDVPQSGKLGEAVASKNHSGPYHRKHSAQRKQPTAARKRAQGEFRAVAKVWGELTDEQYQAWRARARREKSKPKLGKRWSLTAQTYFGRINNPRVAFGKELLLDPPPPAHFPPNPVKRIIIANRAGRIMLKIELSGPPTVDIMVFASRPCKRSVARCFKCPRIGPLPPPVALLSDITKQYVEKHGRPAVGQRIFIRTRQYLDGGQDKFHEFSAVVPAEEGWDSHAKGA
jgi:hypothetical protein